jgi:hypothetical protein
MRNLKQFLKILSKVGYPNSDIQSISKAVSYDLGEFLPDLVAEIGESGAADFATEAINKLSDGDKGIEVPVNEGHYGEYAYIKIHDVRVNLDNDDTTVLVSWSWGDTKILFADEDGEESYVTIQQLYDDAGMDDMGDLEDLWDRIKYDCSTLVYNNCGFGLWFDSFYKR